MGEIENNRADHATQDTAAVVRRGLARRYRAERRFRFYGMAAIGLSLSFLVVLFISIAAKGVSGFRQTFIQLEIYFDPTVVTEDNISGADYQGLVKKALTTMFPEVKGRRQKRALYKLVSPGAVFTLKDMVFDDRELIGKRVSVWLVADDDVDLFVKHRRHKEGTRRLSDQQRQWIEELQRRDRLRTRFNTTFFRAADSREPELAGIWGATVGSALTLLVTLLFSFPIGVAAAIYLEEFAPQNRWTDLIEININNLAAVPSIVFGLLGLAVFLNFFGLPRSSPMVGGLVLSLMTMPVIIIAARAALRSVPPSIREAALAIGASKMQTVMHHVLPLALPGMLTGTIIGMARALGETAPLLMIGMVAFIVETPRGFFDPATVLPVQIYLWSDSPERAFVERTAAATLVLLAFLVLMNGLAVWLRRRYEKRW